MMKASEKIKEYVDALVIQGVGAFTVAPPIHRLLWKMGINITPPFNQTFVTNFILFALWMSGFVSITMTVFVFLSWGFENLSVILAILTKPTFYPVILIAGIFFGLIMAGSIQYRRQYLNVPKW